MTDIDDLRNQHIQLHGLEKVDDAYTFYYDETNNTKKLRVTSQGFNVVDLKVFILGGVVHEGAPRPIDIEQLRRAMKIQASAPEIKLTHVAKGSFLDILQSQKLTIFLKWMTDSGLMLHYQSLDPLYWSTVDIIDSILARANNPMLFTCGPILKSDLTAILRADLTATTTLLFQYNYPSLAPSSRKPFLDALIEMVERHASMLPDFNYNMLKGTLQAGRAAKDLAFIEDNVAHELIDNFSGFYLDRVALFKNSNHILDMEDTIRDHFLETPLESEGKPVNHYRFADSKSEEGIQISDVVVGLLGKLYTFLIDTPHADIAAARDALSGTSQENANLIRALIDTTDSTNIAFLNNVASLHDVDKLDLFLRFQDGRYA